MGTEKNPALEKLYKSIQTFGSIAISAEIRDKLYRYNDALMQSLYSILDDRECDEATKMETFNTSMEQFTAAMKDLFPQLIGAGVSKADINRYDEIVEVDKFNPYHDSKGRFASAQGYSSFTIRTRDPGKQHWADAAIAREQERDAQSNSGSKYKDPATIAGVKRGEPMTREQADQGKANPNFSKGGGYYTNCQSCVVTYEARRRGYDVITKPNTRGSKLEELSHASHKAWIDPKTGKTPERPQSNESVRTPKQCRKMLEDTIQPGERYTFGHSWKGRSRSGHIICADKDSSGNLRLFDPQSGKTMTGNDIDGYLSRIKYTTTVYGMKLNCSPRLLRVDNLTINPAYSNAIMEARVS